MFPKVMWVFFHDWDAGGTTRIVDDRIGKFREITHRATSEHSG